MRRAKNASTYCFSASYFFVGPQRLLSHRRPPRHRHDAASNISEDHRLLLGPFPEATYYFYLPSRVNYLCLEDAFASCTLS